MTIKKYSKSSAFYLSAKEDLRVKYLEIIEKDIEKYLWCVIVARIYNNVYNKDEGMRLYNKFTTLKQHKNGVVA